MGEKKSLQNYITGMSMNMAGIGLVLSNVVHVSPTILILGAILIIIGFTMIFKNKRVVEELFKKLK